MATGHEKERDKQIYYNTCDDLSKTKIKAADLPAKVVAWRLDPLTLVDQFEVCILLTDK